MTVKTKVVCLFLLLICIGIGSEIYVKAVEPEVSSELALKQFENPSTETHTILRNRESFNPFPYLFLGWGGLVVFSFWGNVRRFLNEEIW